MLVRPAIRVRLAREYKFQGADPKTCLVQRVKKPTGPAATTYPNPRTTGERKIGIRTIGSRKLLPGRSVRTSKNANTLPSGTATKVIPSATSAVVVKAR